jgi:hypothetical protein
MGQMNWFGKLFHLVIDYVVRRHVITFFTNLGRIGRWKNPRTSVSSKKYNRLDIYSWTTLDLKGRNNRCYKCNLWKNKNHFEKDCKSTCLCWKWIMECSSHEGKCHAKFVIFCKCFTKKNGEGILATRLPLLLN